MLLSKAQSCLPENGMEMLCEPSADISLLPYNIRVKYHSYSHGNLYLMGS